MYRLADVSTTPLLRALGTLVTLSALVLLGDAGLAPTASAADSSSGTADIKLVIYENKTSDLSISIKISGLSPSNYCTEEYLGNEYDIKTEGDTCIIGVYGVGIDDMSGGSLTIKHRDDVFAVNMSDFNSFDDYESTSLTMIFPGKVTDADSNAKVDGNTASWSNVVSLGSARAEGKDVPDPTPTPNNNGQNQAQGGDEDGEPPLWPLWILLGAVAVVAVTATVVVYAMNNSKKNQLAAQDAYPGAPQYAQYPTQPDYPIAQYPTQPDYPRQHYPPAQPNYDSESAYAPTRQVPLFQANGYAPQQDTPTQQHPGRGGYDTSGQSGGYDQPGQQQPYNPSSGQPGYDPRPPYNPQQPHNPNDQY